jgi:hypothetical protein
VDHQFLEEGDIVQSGMTISFPCHKALVSKKIPLNLAQAFDNAAAPSLKFEHGLSLEHSIRKRFVHPMNFFGGPRRRELFLVISFGRSCFRLNIHTVAIVLQACFGGLASLFRVKLLRGRTSKF